MSKEIALEIKVKSDTVEQANKRMGTAQQELRRIKNELASGELKGEAFEQAAQRAAKLQDSIGDVNKRVRALASDTKKLDAFIGVAQGIAGGFAAAQGAAALFGSQNEDLQKTMVKLQAAMSLLNGVQAVANTLNKDSAFSTILLSRAKKAMALATGQATGAMKIFRIALISTGVGALVVAIGALIAGMSKLISGIQQAAKQANDLAASQTALAKETVNAYNQFDEQERTLRRLGVAEEEIQAQREKAFRKSFTQLKAAAAANLVAINENNASLEKISKWERLGFGFIPRLLYGDKDEIKKQSQDAKKNIDDLTKQIDKLLNDQFDIEDKKKKDQDKKDQDERKKQAERRQKANEVDIERRLMLIQDEEKRERALLQNKQRLQMQQAKVNGENLTTLAQLQEQERQQLIDKFREKERHLEEEQSKFIDAERKRRNKELEEEEARTQARIIAKYDEAEKKRIDNARESDALLLESKREGQAAIFQLLQSIEKGTEQEQKKAFNRNKALAIAETTINTYDAAQRAYKSQLALSTPDAPIRATIAAAAAIASGLARVKQISSQNFKGSGGGGATSTGGGAGAAAFQRTPIAPQVRGVEIEDRRVYVLEGDISRTQRRVRTLEQQSIID